MERWPLNVDFTCPRHGLVAMMLIAWDPVVQGCAVYVARQVGTDMVITNCREPVTMRASV